MKPVYKTKADNIITAVEGRIKLVKLMIDGKKQANPREAQRYLDEALNGLEKLEELVSIS